MTGFVLRAGLLWLGFLALAVANGVAREKLAEPRIGKQAAHVAHTLLFCAAALALIRWFVRAEGLAQAGALLALGACWTAMTVAFECWMVRVLRGEPWSAVWADYDLRAGRVWLLVLLTLLLGPLLTA